MKKRTKSGSSRPRKKKAKPARWTDAEIQAGIDADPDAAPELDDAWFEKAEWIPPMAKEPVYIRLDGDVLRHFRKGGPRYQTRINAVLRTYMEAQERKKDH